MHVKTNDSTTKTCIGYVRVSTADQAREGVSLKAQREAIKRWAHGNGYRVGNIFQDAGLSAKTTDRPGLQAALKALQPGQALVVYSLSRMSRSTKDAISIADELSKRGCDLVSITESIDTTSAMGKLFFTMIAAMGQMERELVGERTRAALDHKRRQGEVVSRHCPYGFRRDPSNPKRLSPVASEIKALRWMSQWRGTGLSLRKIARKLADMGAFNRLGKVFSPGSISAILATADRYSHLVQPAC